MATGEVIKEYKFQSKDFIDKVLIDPVVKERLYSRLCDEYVFKYRAGIDGGIDDVIITEDFIDEEG